MSAIFIYIYHTNKFIHSAYVYGTGIYIYIFGSGKDDRRIERQARLYRRLIGSLARIMRGEGQKRGARSQLIDLHRRTPVSLPPYDKDDVREDQKWGLAFLGVPRPYCLDGGSPHKVAPENTEGAVNLALALPTQREITFSYPISLSYILHAGSAPRVWLDSHLRLGQPRPERISI